MEYIVSWTIEVEADDPESAARLARAGMPCGCNPDSLAVFFEVREAGSDRMTIVELREEKSI